RQEVFELSPIIGLDPNMDMNSIAVMDVNSDGRDDIVVYHWTVGDPSSQEINWPVGDLSSPSGPSGYIQQTVYNYQTIDGASLLTWDAAGQIGLFPLTVVPVAM